LSPEEKMVEAEQLMLSGVSLAHTGAVELIVENAGLKEYIKNHEFESAKLDLIFNPGQENAGWGDCYYYKNDEPSTLSNEVVVCGGRSGIINAKKERFVIDWNNLIFTQGPYATGWGASIGKVVGKIDNCTFSNLGNTRMTLSESPRDGHNIYAKPDGQISCTGNKFLSCGGNTQFAARPWEQVMPNKISVVLKKNFWSDCSWNPVGHGGGGSFNIAAYCNTEEGTDIVVEDCIFHNAIPYPGLHITKSEPSARGVIALWNEAWYPPKKATDKGFEPDAKYYFKSLKFNNNVIRTTEPDRTPISIKGCKDIEIKNLKVDYIDYDGKGKHFIKIDEDPDNPNKATRIRIDPIDADGTMLFGGWVVQLRDGLVWDAKE